MRINHLLGEAKKEDGATLVIVAAFAVALIGCAALAIDLTHLYVVKNELQNAADAGALAGARFLYNNDGTEVNTGANAIGYNAARANKSENVEVDVHWSGGNAGDVQRGHWSFASRTFTPNDSTAPVDLWNVSSAELDANENFINAVRVTARREETPATTFFAKIFGYQSHFMSAEAVAYIGFSGTILPYDIDQPIAVCKQSLLVDGKYSCAFGRMLNSGSGADHNTAGWTNFSQPCTTANNPTISPFICSSGNLESITLGSGIGTTGGTVTSTYKSFRDCWLAHSAGGTQPWTLKLPVIDCPGNNVSNCAAVVGSVTVTIVWMFGEGQPIHVSDYPTQMGAWRAPETTDINAIWNDFASTFNLKMVDGANAIPMLKAMYFLPDCAPHVPSGQTGGENFGVLARIPSLVR